MTDEAYANINGLPKMVQRKQRVTYPSTNEGFRKMVLAYGTHLCVGVVLGGQMRTSVVANTSKINTAYNASVALEAAYNSSFANIDLNATAKAQQASAVSSNHSGFYFDATVRGGNRNDGSLSALSSVLTKMSKARQGAGTQDDLVDDSDTKVTISDDSEEFELAGEEWMNSLTVANGLSQEDVLRKMQMLKEHMEEDRASLSRKLLGRSESDDRLSGYNDRELARLRREALVLGYTVPVRIRYRDAGRDTSQVFLLVHADEFAYKPALWEVQGRYKPKTYPAVSVLVKREFYYEPLFEKRFWEPWHKFLKAEEDRYYRNGRRW